MLRQLELFGFKSFADRTTFQFAPGITCVVGPNGSGKSNVVDAIKWILGDQSAKSLRGQEMADVIFNGSAGRKPAGFAEATLTFDNSDRRLRVDADEVRVGRRLYRSGDSEYLLNGAVVRLKDVRDAFLGTAAGTSAYSIIEQGRVDQILQANPAARRIVFEEAAGISRYKNRRTDAERRLERVEQNLTRLRDIVREVETQLSATRGQATKAARYRELAGELRELWTGLAADEYRRLTGAGQQLDAQICERRERLDALQLQLSRLETAQGELETELAAVDERLQRALHERSANRELIAARESTIRHQAARQRELEAELAELRRERQHLGVRARAVVDELAENAARLGAFDAQLTQQQQSLADRQEEVQRLEAELTSARCALEEQRRKRDRLLEEAAVHHNRAAVAAAQHADLLRAHDAAERHAAELGEAVARAAAGRDALQSAAERAAAVHQRLICEVERLQGERMRLLDEQGHSQNSLAAMREQRITWDARLHILEGLQQRQEGLGLGVREILHRAQTVHAPPWNEIVGCVGELLDVPLEHAALLEIALGSRAQVIVTRRLDGLADYLNSGAGVFAGRVGFLEAPLSESLQPQSAATFATASAEAGAIDLSGQPGVVTRADQLASEAEHVRGLAARLLSDTWIVETLTVARQLAKRHPGQRFVTRQGELLDSDGALYAGLAPHEMSLVSRRSELRRLRAELRQLDADIGEQLRELEALGQCLTSVDGDLAGAQQERDSAARSADEARMAAAAQERELDRLVADGQRAQQDRDELAGRMAEIAAALEQERAAAAVRRSDAESLAAAAAELEGQIAAAARLLDAAQQDMTRQQLELAMHRERVRALRDVQTRLEHDQQQRQRQWRQADERLQAASAARRGLLLEILHAEAEIAELSLAAESLDRQLDEFNSERARLRARRGALGRDQDRLHAARRALSDELHQADLQRRELQHQVAAWETRIEEEYQLRLAELAADGVSALQHWRTRTDAGADDGASDRNDPGQEVNDREPGDDPSKQDPGNGGSDDELRREIEEHVHRLRRKLKALGHVNTESLDSLDELEQRYTQLAAQLQDLEAARTALEEIIRRINGESRRLFHETFAVIRGHFRELFRKLFGGGEADLVLEDPDDVLECGIDIVARPPGKELRSISLLSGGEKTLTAVALLFAMFNSKPSPYCILDEVDAALDEANVDRYAAILKDFVGMTQFIVITHRKRTMTAADVIYGVTMEQAGVSKRMSVRFEDVRENGEIDSRAGRAA